MTEWEQELKSLRADLGPTVQMRAKWRWKRQDLGWRATWGAWSLLMKPPDDNVVFTLYDEDAVSGDEPIVEIEVEPHGAPVALPQASIVQVAGRPLPGHAAVIVVRDLQFWPIYPGTLGLRSPAFAGDGPEVIGPPRKHAQLRTRRARVVGVIVLAILTILTFALRWVAFENTDPNAPPPTAPITGSR